MGNVKAGLMRHRITLQTLSSVVNAIGEAIPTYTDRVTVWAEIINVRGRETFAGRKLSGETTHIIKTRYRNSVSIKDRIKFTDKSGSTRYFDIISSMNFDERDVWILIDTKERIGN